MVKLRICRFFAVGIKTKVFYLHPVTDDSLPSGGKRDILEEGAAVRAQRVAAHEGGRYGKGDRDRESGL